MKQHFKKVCVLTTVLAVAGCQGALPTISSIVETPEPAQETAKMEVIPTGGIIMKKSYEGSWEMPKREVDVLRAEMVRLQRELLSMQTGQAQQLAQKFNEVENRVREMRMEEMRQAAKDAELMALVKAKFDVIDKNIDFLKASEVQQINEKDSLLAVLDDKFKAVEDRLVTLDQTDSLQNEKHKAELQKAFFELESLKSDKDVLIKALDQKFGEIETASGSLKQGLEQVSYEQEIQRRIAQARKQAMEEAREIRMLEELELRKQVEETRRTQIASLVRENENKDVEHAKKQAELENKLSDIKNKLSTMEAEEAKRLAEEDARREEQQKMLDARLSAVKEEYDQKFALLEAEKAKAGDSSALDQSLEDLQAEYERTLKEAEDYRMAIEERVFGMSAKSPMTSENIQSKNLGVGRVIESTAQIDGVEISAAPDGGLVGGYNQGDWMDLEDYQVVLHESNTELDDILKTMMKRAEPFVGPWTVKWKLKSENMDVLQERFSLDVETDFNAFVSYLSNYMKSYRGFGLTFNIFRKERILVITD